MLFLESGLYFTRVIGLMMALSTAEKGVQGWIFIGLGHNIYKQCEIRVLCETSHPMESSLACLVLPNLLGLQIVLDYQFNFSGVLAPIKKS